MLGSPNDSRGFLWMTLPLLRNQSAHDTKAFFGGSMPWGSLFVGRPFFPHLWAVVLGDPGTKRKHGCPLDPILWAVVFGGFGYRNRHGRPFFPIDPLEAPGGLPEASAPLRHRHRGRALRAGGRSAGGPRPRGRSKRWVS